MKEDIKAIWGILRDRYLFLYLIFAIGVYIEADRLLALGAIAIYLVFDLIGYEAVPDEYNYFTQEFNRNKKSTHEVRSYRIIQKMFFVLLTVLLYHLNKWQMVGFLILHQFGYADLLYYVCGGYDLKDEVWTWMKWTPYGFFKVIRAWIGKKLHKSYPTFLTSTEVLVQAVIGFLIYILIVIAEWYFIHWRI